MFTIPNWRTMGEVDDLGGTLNIVVLAQNDNAQPSGTIVSIVPAPGTVVPISSEITVTTIRNLLTDPIPGS
jgi:beta-lactam-binding protein with PASTA domain